MAETEENKNAATAEEETADETTKAKETEEKATSENKEDEKNGDTAKASEDKKENNSGDELEQTKKALKDANDKYVRLFAEFDNYRKRTTKEKTESYNDAVADCVKQILPIIDNFELAMTHPCEDEKFLQGMEMILKQFRTILDKMNVKEINALGEKFDPAFHNAIRQADSDKYETDTVCEVYQKGYTLDGRLIRPAMVAVVK